jgi:hypothetical protein
MAVQTDSLSESSEDIVAPYNLGCEEFWSSFVLVGLDKTKKTTGSRWELMLKTAGVRAKPPCEFTPRDRRGVCVSILCWPRARANQVRNLPLTHSPRKKELGRWRNADGADQSKSLNQVEVPPHPRCQLPITTALQKPSKDKFPNTREYKTPFPGLSLHNHRGNVIFRWQHHQLPLSQSYNRTHKQIVTAWSRF